MRELEAFASNFGPRHRAAASELESLRDERDQAIRRAHLAGVPVVAIAELFAISHQRVSSIVRR